jgi:hypothetical protein
MPYKSMKQERWANANAGKPGGMSRGQVSEWNAASKGIKLPMRKLSMKAVKIPKQDRRGR